MDIKNRQQNIQKILLRAFRERWPEYQFGIKIKQALPLALPADAYNLTEVLLDLSLIGIGANKLFLSYLKHSLHSHLISYSAVIKRITKYSQYERYFCLIALLEFLINISDTCCCRTKPEESSLMNAILSLVHWLIELSEKIFLKIMEQNNIPTHEQKVCLERITTLNNRIVNNQFLMGIIYLAKLEDRELYEKCVMSYKRIHSLSKEDFIKDFYQMIFNKLDHMPMKELEPRCVESISVCLQPFIAIEVLINASADVSVNVSKLLMIQKLKKYSNARLYHEIIRSCFITLCHVKDVNYRIWGAFTLCKVPLILKQLHLQAKNVDEKLDYSEDVVKAFEMLLECTPILDLLDTTFACNSIECILVELRKQNLVNDDIMKKLVDRRISSMGKLEKFQISSTSPPIDKYVATIEPTLTALIQSLCEPIKPEFLNVLNTLVIDNRAFLLYSVAAVKGIHRKMISGLIKCNESCKEISGEAAKSKQNIIFRSNAFDVTFIMLFSIMQKCGGIDKFPEKSNDYFFEKWIRDGYIDLQSKPRSPLSVVKMSDSRLEELIAYFNDINQQPSPPISNKLSEICWSIPSLLYNCIIAWEKDMVKPAAVKNIIDNMRSKNCCFAIVAASWLCAYMKILKDDELAKPKVMLQQLMNPLDESIMKQETFSERFHLTQEIIMKLSRSVLDTKKATNNSNDSLFSDQWKDITTKKWLSYEVAINLDEILKSCGSFWIMKNLVDEIMHTKFIKDMENTLDIAFAIMHLNIESCTETLLKDILISMLFNKNQMSKITNPQSKALAKISIYGILATIESAESSSQKKRPREDDDLSQAAKMRKTGIDQAVSIESTQNDKDQSSQQLKDSLRHSLQELFKVFHQQVVTDDELSPKINFIFQFFSLLVQFEKSVKIKAILRLIPTGLVMNLLKLVHQDDLTYGFILRLYDLSVSSGRLSAISDLCLLKNIKMKSESSKL